MYNIASPEINKYKIGGPAPCTDADHQFRTIIVFRARNVLYLNASRIPPGQIED